jgi:hypothetical protein
MTRTRVMNPCPGQRRVRHQPCSNHVGDGLAVSVVRKRIVDLPSCPRFGPGRLSTWWRCGSLHLFPFAAEYMAQLVCMNRARRSTATAPQGVTGRPSYLPMFNSAPLRRAIVQPQVGLVNHVANTAPDFIAGGFVPRAGLNARTAVVTAFNHGSITVNSTSYERGTPPSTSNVVPSENCKVMPSSDEYVMDFTVLPIKSAKLPLDALVFMGRSVCHF